MKPLIAIDADVLGRRRTGDETYVAALLRELSAIAEEEHLVAVTRHPELVPDGIEAHELPARRQAARMLFGLPRALRRLRPSLAHFLYVVPPAYRGPAVITAFKSVGAALEDLAAAMLVWRSLKSVVK